VDESDTEALPGAIVDTNSTGRFELVISRDGILAVTGTYLGVALRAAGVSRSGRGEQADG
jgi:hypothetical protein